MARKPGKKKTQFRKNRQARARARPERSLTGVEGDWEEEEGFEGSERIVPPGQDERQRDGISRNQALEGIAENTQLPIGRITLIRSRLCEVDLGGEVMTCQLRGKFKEISVDQRSVIAVGDRVMVEQQKDGTGLIRELLPRTNELARISYTHNRMAHVIAANVDLMVIVSSVHGPPLWPGLIDRYLVVAHHQGLTPLVAINKSDQDEDEEIPRCLEEYASLGYQGIRLSAATGEGMDELREWLRGKTSVFAGQSGVGKSSILNVLKPEFELETGEISAATNKGRHVTHSASLLSLEKDTYVVDTPGVRTFDPYDLILGQVEAAFPEIAALAPKCRFQNCEHDTEPKCAVKDAVENGTVLERRYRSFRSIVE
ncbi:MAG: ribosome small subunit-dependent GTPase A [Planctomycetota bacterium]|nr:ribosome small subunit-dependent GTPase A [Planctomycetota bacterium]MDA1137754.1 ribosome small subunit-dependent GTPase A [Planctomycetota bacterium]